MPKPKRESESESESGSDTETESVCDYPEDFDGLSEAASTAYTVEQDAEIEKLTREQAAIKNQYEELNKRILTLSTDLTTVRTANETLMRENTVLKTQMATLQTEHRRTVEDIAALKNKVIAECQSSVTFALKTAEQALAVSKNAIEKSISALEKAIVAEKAAGASKELGSTAKIMAVEAKTVAVRSDANASSAVKRLDGVKAWATGFCSIYNSHYHDAIKTTHEKPPHPQFFVRMSNPIDLTTCRGWAVAIEQDPGKPKVACLAPEF